MNLRHKYLPFALLVALAAFAFAPIAAAGEIHEGYGSTKIGAMKQANDVAKAAAGRKATCWKPANIKECKKDADGYWTAYAYSANHLGSCGRGGYLSPSASVGVYDDGTADEPPGARTGRGSGTAPSSRSGTGRGSSDDEDQPDGQTENGRSSNGGNNPESATETDRDTSKGPGPGRLDTGEQVKQTYLFIGTVRDPIGECFRERLVERMTAEASGSRDEIQHAFRQRLRRIYPKTLREDKTRVISATKWTIVFSYDTSPGDCTNTTIGFATGVTEGEARRKMQETLKIWEATNSVELHAWGTPHVSR